MQAKILIIGCGDLGTQVAINLQSLTYEVIGVRISDMPLPANIHTIQADVTRPETLILLKQTKPDYIVYCVAASAKSTLDVDENIDYIMSKVCAIYS